MESMVLVLLGGAGLGILVSALRPHQGAVPRSNIDTFRRRMAALGGGGHMRRHAAATSTGRTVLVLEDAQRVAGPSTRSLRRAQRRPRRAPATRRPAPGRAGQGWVTASRRGGGVARAGRSPATPAARRRGAVLRVLVAAVLVGVVAWATLGAVGAALLGVSLVALVAYCALLAGVSQAPPPARRRARPRQPQAAGRRARPAPPGGRRPESAERAGGRDRPVARGA